MNIGFGYSTISLHHDIFPMLPTTCGSYGQACDVPTDFSLYWPKVQLEIAEIVWASSPLLVRAPASFGFTGYYGVNVPSNSINAWASPVLKRPALNSEYQKTK